MDETNQQIEHLKKEMDALRKDCTEILRIISSMQQKEDSRADVIKQWSESFAKAVETRLKKLEQQLDVATKQTLNNEKKDSSTGRTIARLEKRLKALESEQYDMTMKYDRLVAGIRGGQK